MNKEDLNVYDEPQCEEFFSENSSEIPSTPSRPVDESPYEGWEGSWPGDGSGMDDFADYNSSEGGDY